MDDKRVGSAATVGAGPIGPVPLSEVKPFDQEADVLVIGFGCAGAAASLEAASVGADVLVLERFSGPGGSSAQSGGEIYLSGGTRVQKACGFDETAEDMYGYLHAALGPHPDEAKLRLYCDQSVEHFEWLCARGVPLDESLYDASTWMPPTSDGLMWLGENAWPYTTYARPVPRGHRPAAPGFAGSLLMKQLAAAAATAGVRTHIDTRASALVVDRTGTVVGVVARHYGHEVRYRACNGVPHHGRLRRQRRDAGRLRPNTARTRQGQRRGDDGCGIVMASALGAATRRMGVVEMALTAQSAIGCRGVLVNAHGQRFINEDVYPGMFSHAALHQPAPWWVIIDEADFESLSARDSWGVRAHYAAETLAVLEAELGIPAGALESTVAMYNRHVARGEDPLLHKDPTWLRELKARSPPSI